MHIFLLFSPLDYLQYPVCYKHYVNCCSTALRTRTRGKVCLFSGDAATAGLHTSVPRQQDPQVWSPRTRGLTTPSPPASSTLCSCLSVHSPSPKAYTCTSELQLPFLLPATLLFLVSSNNVSKCTQSGRHEHN